MIGLKTIRAGERAAVWDRHGRVKLVDGPRLLLLYGQAVEALPLHAALPDEYLVVRYRDGRREHICGPASLWFDPVRHEDISVEPALAIDANEAVVIYRREESGAVTRRVARGPELFVPAANEWLHQFCWHGADPKTGRRKIPGALRFTKLHTIPDQMYFDVEEVRTADDALLTIKLMVFFELADLEKMLDQTHDPVADFINAVSADVIDFAATLSFEKFKEQTERLNDLATYRQLVQRGARIGFQINKVVYRGYHASDKLQKMHDDAIEARTKLRLEAETEAQAQQLADLKLQREAVRAVERRKMEEADVTHQNKVKMLAHEESLRQLKAEQQQEQDATRANNELALAHRQALHHEQAAYLKEIREMQVDLTRYLVARYQNPDRLIRVEGGGNGRAPALHLHE